MNERVYMLEVEGRMDRSRSCARRLNEVKRACNVMSLELSGASVVSMDKEQRRDLVSGKNGGVNR